MQTSKPGSGYRFGVYGMAAATVATVFQPTPYIGEAMRATPHEPSAASQTFTGFDERLLNAKLEAVEARTETKFERLLGRIDSLVSDVASVKADIARVQTTASEAKTAAANGKTYVIGTGIAIAGTVIGLLAYGAAMFDLARSLAGLGK